MSTSLNDRYRNVETMRNARTAVTPRKTARSVSVSAEDGTAQMSPQSAPAADGIGRPTNQRLSTTWICTLKRARRSAPHTANRNETRSPARPKAERPQR